MTLAEFEYAMEGVALRNGKDVAEAVPPSLDEFYDDLAAEARLEARMTRH